MKKLLALFSVFMILLTFSSCKKETPNEGSDNRDNIEYLNTINLLPKKFTYTDASGIWSTVVNLEADGSFSGRFEENNLFDATSDYPGGTVRYCDFSGKFTKMHRRNEYSYSLWLEELTPEKEKGETEVTDGVRYISDTPFGLAKGAEYILYLPETATSLLPDEFLFYWPYLPEGLETLHCYALKNVNASDGFFS